MERSTNVLAELAKELGEIAHDLRSDDFYRSRISKAQRIVAELAKVKVMSDDRVYMDDCEDAWRNCRAIAEEGAK